MKKLSALIKKEAESLQKDVDNKKYYAKTLWDATPEEIMQRATQSVLREYDLTGLDGNQLTLLGSKRQPMYLAKITGQDERYGIKREFVSNPDRGRNNYTFELEADTYYAWKESKVEYFGYFDGEQMAIMTKDEMIAAFEEKEVEEVIEEETTTVENEEIKEVTIDFEKIVNLLDDLTQKEIADKTGISQAAISKYKRGETTLTKMSVENAMKLVELYEQVQNAKLNEEIKGVNEASYESNFLGGWQSKYMQLVYNKADNQVWYEIFTGPIGGSFLQLNDEDDISLGFITGTVSPGEIVSAVKATLKGDYYLWH